MNDGLYILMLSIHGLVRRHDMELGRDADTGGQVKYVVELAEALGRHKDVGRVDLVTRRIFSDKHSDDYAREREPLDGDARIVRVPCGPRRYFRKEVLWPHLDEFVDNVLKYLRSIRRIPDVVHGHYADAGLVAARLSQLLGVPMFFTGHSLGRDKLERLSAKGMARERIQEIYRIDRRIEAEEIALGNAWAVVASTRQERDEQYKSYENYDPGRIHVVPPGVDLGRFSPPRRSVLKSGARALVDRFLREPGKPLVLALSRPDEKKNIPTLVRAFAETPGLTDAANLAVVAGNRDDVAAMEGGTAKVFRRLLLDIDKYDLYGRVAYPKRHAPGDVPDFYRLAAHRKGVFVNPALTEPFGLTILEAAATGLPVVATENGGPVEILDRCGNGTLVAPSDHEGMGRAVKALVSDADAWAGASRNGLKGVRRHYSWQSHVASYVRLVKGVARRKRRAIRLDSPKSRLPLAERLVVSDIDNTLLGDAEGLRAFLRRLEESGERVGFGVATGRHLESTMEVLWEWGVPVPDIMICAVGSELYYGPECCAQDKTWRQHIDHRWHPEAVEAVMRGVPGLTPQPPENQGPFKRSYYFDVKKGFPGFRELRRRMRLKGVRARMIHSHGEYIDFLPLRASKGQAIRHLCLRWGMPLERVLVAGDSGNDKQMLQGSTKGVVVGNHSRELKTLRPGDNLYFAQGRHAWGIMEGMDHYGF